MAHATTEQRDAARELIAAYGDPLTTHIEYTPEAYGIVRIDWSLDSSGLGKRQILIKPDGTRLSFRELVLA